MTAFSEMLAEKLGTLYTMPCGVPGHDNLHCLRMISMESRIKEVVPKARGVPSEVFEAAVWLHNLDRYLVRDGRLPQKGSGNGKEVFAKLLFEEWLNRSNLFIEHQEQIVDAAVNHSRLEDRPEDGVLLRMVRLADKVDRMTLIGFSAGFSFNASLPAYQPGAGYGSTAEGRGGMKTNYDNIFRVVEWYRMSADVRAYLTVNEGALLDFRDLLGAVRSFARTVARAHGTRLTIEEDLRRALGEFYEKFE